MKSQNIFVLIFPVLLGLVCAQAAWAATPPEYSITIEEQAVNGLNVVVNGSAAGSPYAGQLEQHQVSVDWGDGKTNATSTIDFIDLGDKYFEGTWFNTHDYGSSGTYLIVVKLYHAQPQGQESNVASDSITIVIEPPPLLENTLELCTDQTDNDSDDLVDLNDPDCSAFVPKLIIAKLVVNDNNGTATAGDFTITVSGASEWQTSFPGSASGTTVELAPGAYTVTETGPAGYFASTSSECSGTITAGQTKTCSITNNDQPETRPAIADLALTAFVDDPTPNESQLVTITLALTNNGPATATNVAVSDSLPPGLAFISATASQGIYNATTSFWNVGTLSSGSNATLTLQATVNPGTAGQTIIITAQVSADQTDPNASNSSANQPLNINVQPEPAPAPTPAPTPPPSGGGGGGQLPENIFLAPGLSPVPTTTAGQVLGASIGVCQAFISGFLGLGKNNNPDEVRKLQIFLNQYEGEHLPVTGFFGPITFAAVKRFQAKYAQEILQPWAPAGSSATVAPTGYVYLTTLRKIQVMVFGEANLPMTQLP